MKTKKLTYVCLAIILLTGCNKDDETTPIDDNSEITSDMIANEDFYAYLLENFDINKDKKLSKEETKAVKEINYSDYNQNKLSLIWPPFFSKSGSTLFGEFHYRHIGFKLKHSIAIIEPV